MDCKRAQELIMKYVDGSIDQNDRRELIKHTDKCTACSEELSIMLETIELIEDLEELNPPDDLENMVMKKIDVRKYSKSNKKLFICVFLSIFLLTGIIGIVFNKVFSSYISVKDLLIMVIVNFTNFIVLTLPNILYLVSRGLNFISSVIEAYSGVLILLLMLLALIEMYFVKIIKHS